MEIISLLWNNVVLGPMVNALVILYVALFHNFGLSIIAFTVIIRLVTLPLTLRQIRQTRAMAQLQPKLKEIQQKYGKDRTKISQETMRMYKDHGVSPLGCLGPLVVQMPILIGLFYAILQTLPIDPGRLVDLSRRLYDGLGFVHGVVPVDGGFLWMNLAESDPSPIIMPVLVGLSTWVQQKMATMPTTDARQQSTNTMMLWMFPLMLGVFTFSFPSGLALYWVTSNLIGVAIQYRVTGWGNLFRSTKNKSIPAPVPTLASEPVSEPEKEIVDNGQRRDISEDRGRSGRDRPPRARRNPRRGRSRRS